MRALLLLLWSLGAVAYSMAQDDADLLTDLRSNMRAVFEDKAVLDRLKARMAGSDAFADPLLTGYKGILLMAEAKHRSNPFSRFGPFNEGKALLDGAIAAAPTSVELRFLRMSVQTNVPGILRYSANRAEDRAFIEAHLHEVKNEQLRRRIIDFIARAVAEERL